MKTINIPTICAFLAILCACSNKEEAAAVEDDESYGRLGKYVYLDDNEIYHIRQSCIRLTRGKDEFGHDTYAKQLIDTAEFSVPTDYAFRVCSHCVNDKKYEQLVALSNRNKQKRDNDGMSH